MAAWMLPGLLLVVAAVGARLQAGRVAQQTLQSRTSPATSPRGTVLGSPAFPGARVFRPSADPAFGDAAPALRVLLCRGSIRMRGLQHFWIVGYQDTNGGAAQAWVYWREQRLLILWWGGTAPESLLWSNRKLRLDRDVVEREADIGGSTYLVTRAWANQVVADAQRCGDRYQLDARQ